MTNDSGTHRDLDGWADLLADAYAALESGSTSGLPDLPPTLNDLSIEDAYRVQDLTLDRLRATYGSTGRGYKVGGGAKLMCGVVLNSRLLDSGVTVDIHANNVPLVEPEILLRTTADLSGDVSTDEIAADVEMGAGFELPIGRFRSWHPMAPGAMITLTSMVADNGLAGLLVQGGTWRPGLDPAELANLTADVQAPGQPSQTGRANPKVGTAYDTTKWLISNLADRDRVLPKGSIIATGTLLPATPAVPGDYSATFSHDLGEVRFTAI